MKNQLSEEGREQLALALIIWKDFKSEGRYDPDLTIQMIRLADHIGVRAELDKLIPIVPRMKVIPR